MGESLEGLSDDDLIELELLRDFETDALIEADLLSTDEQQLHPLDRELIFNHDELDLHVTAGSQYPACSVNWHVENHALSRVAIISLRDALRQIVEAAESTNNLARWQNRELECEMGIFEPVKVVLALAQETRSCVDKWRALHPELSSPSGRSNSESYLPFTTKNGVSIPASICLVPTATATTTTSNLAFQLLQKTPQDICAAIPPSYRVLHVEEIIRSDLAAAFARRRNAMRETLSRQPYRALKSFVPAQHNNGRKEDLVEHLSRPRLTFHGTQRQFVASIVRHGFLTPGAKHPDTKEAHSVRCGSTYGRGIYSSPDADFSLSYTDPSCHRTEAHQFFGLKLLVCATLMGRSAQMDRTDNWRSQTEPYPGVDSHVANYEREYVVFSSSQILPVYVIHIDWGQDNAQHFVDLPDDAASYTPPKVKKIHPQRLAHVIFPGDVQRQKAATLARAAKYFPYGFGPATGRNFVVEEIGEVDDDEEEYGDYQEFRVDGADEGSGKGANMDYWSWVKAGWEEDAAIAEEEGHGVRVDEYTHEKSGNKLAYKSALISWSQIPLPPDLGSLGENYEAKEFGEGDDGDDFGLDRLMLENGE
ncbi:ADP-ribosylation [Xylariaceae sp. FL1651]|nr:ADP-ribosylation [Xylariaceae sp. FL1651]